MKVHLIWAIAFAALSPLAFSCENGTPVTAIVTDGKSFPVTEQKQQTLSISPDENKLKRLDASPAKGSEHWLCTTATSHPMYPPLARKARIQGHVILEALIGKEGSVSELKLISGHPMLVKAAMDAVRQWRYKPYLHKGKPVQVKTTVDVSFSLSGG